MGTKYGTGSLTEGAMLAAITVLLSLVGAYLIPYVSLIIPVPLAILVYRRGLRAGIMVSVTSALLAGMAVGMVYSLLLLLVMGLIGIALGEAMREKFEPGKIMVVGTIVAVGAFVLLLAAARVLFEIDTISMMFQSFEKALDQAASVYTKMGIPEDQITDSTEMMKQTLELMKKLLPVVFLMSAAGITFLNYWLSRLILRRLGEDLPWFSKFSTWRFPWWLVWGFIMGVGISLAAGYFESELLADIGTNLYILFLYVYFVQGLSVIWFFFDKHKTGKFLRILTVILVLSPGLPFAMLVSWAGVLDVWLDFRKLKTVTY